MIAPRRTSLAVVVVLLAAMGGAPAAARAQDVPRDPAAAEALFEEGKRLMEAKRVAEACPKFEESYRLDPGVGALLNLAACEEQRGKVASAWGHYREAGDLLRREKDQRRAAFADERAAALAPRLPKVVITAISPPPGFTVTRDGIKLSGASFGAELPVDPGEHELVAEAPDHLARKVVFTAKEREVARVTIEALDPAPPPEPPPIVAPISRPPTEGSEGDPGLTQRRIGFITGAVGLATLAVGGVFIGITASNKGKADEGCPTPTTCTEAGFSDVEVAKDTAMVANVTLISGAVLTAAGVVLVLTAPSRSTSALSIAPEVGPRQAGLGARGTF